MSQYKVIYINGKEVTLVLSEDGNAMLIQKISNKILNTKIESIGNGFKNMDEAEAYFKQLALEAPYKELFKK